MLVRKMSYNVNFVAIFVLLLLLCSVRARDSFIYILFSLLCDMRNTFSTTPLPPSISPLPSPSLLLPASIPPLLSHDRNIISFLSTSICLSAPFTLPVPLSLFSISVPLCLSPISLSPPSPLSFAPPSPLSFSRLSLPSTLLPRHGHVSDATPGRRSTPRCPAPSSPIVSTPYVLSAVHSISHAPHLYYP